MSIFLRWGIPALVTVVGGTSLAISATSEGMIEALTARATTALADGQSSWASVSFDARDAVITGTAGDQQTIDRAVATVAAVRGVRSVRSGVVLAEFVSPFPFTASIANGEISLAGGVPDERTHAELIMETGSANDSLRLLAGAPPTDQWRAAVDYGLAHLRAFDEGTFTLEDLDISITGRAKSAEAYDELAVLASEVPPEGVKVALRDVHPALASPFVFEAHYDGTRVVASGFTPSTEFAERLQRDGIGGHPVSTSLILASGAPDGFEENAMVLLENLVMLEEGSASISDTALALEGAPADRESAEAIDLAMTGIGATLSLTPPRADIYEFVASRSGGTTTLEGFVPNAQTRDRLEALAGVDASALELARGAPERFDSGVEFGLDLLEHMSEGRFTLQNASLSVEGRAASAADFAAVDTILSLGAPQGLRLAHSDIRPPIATPFVWSARKRESGDVEIAGYVPSETVKLGFHAAVADLASDSSTIADGNPPNFEAEAGAALGILPQFETASIEYDGTGWTLSGRVGTFEAAEAVEEAFAAAGLDAAGWVLELDAPPPPVPVADPYVWRAEKLADGRVALSGYVTTEEMRRFLAVRAGDLAADTTEIATGEPAGFVANALAGLEALKHLTAGTVTVDGETWTLAGTPRTVADADLATAAVAEAVAAGGTWITNLSPPEEQTAALDEGPTETTTSATDGDATADESGADAPAAESPDGLVVADLPEQPDVSAEVSETVVPSFVFSAVKPLDSAIALRGAVPGESARRFLGLTAGSTPDDLSVSANLPEGFLQNADTGIRLLAALDAGEFGFDGTTWVLRGQVESEAERQVALANIAGIAAARDWRTEIGLLPPIDVCRRKVGAFASRNAVLFQSGSARLAEESLPALDELAGYLGACPETTIYVEGHTDADGDDELNLALSVARAEAVVEALIERGVSYRRLYAVGYGESLPIADNDTAAGKRANRRIGFSIVDRAE